jgi:hypothetical protein
MVQPKPVPELAGQILTLRLDQAGSDLAATSVAAQDQPTWIPAAGITQQGYPRPVTGEPCDFIQAPMPAQDTQIRPIDLDHLTAVASY